MTELVIWTNVFDMIVSLTQGIEQYNCRCDCEVNTDNWGMGGDCVTEIRKRSK